MRHLLGIGLLAVVLGCGLARAEAPKPFPEKALTPQQFGELHRGGFVIYMRHVKTDSSQSDQLNPVFSDCSTQRRLSDEGRQMARDIGSTLRKARIPVNEVFVSPMCRTRETAQLVFGKRAKITVIDELFSSANQTSEQKKPTIATTRRLLSEAVVPGSNRFIIAHAPNLADTLGYFPKLEGTVVVFRPLGDGFDYIGSIRPDMWSGLLR